MPRKAARGRFCHAKAQQKRRTRHTHGSPALSGCCSYAAAALRQTRDADILSGAVTTVYSASDERSKNTTSKGQCQAPSVQRVPRLPLRKGGFGGATADLTSRRRVFPKRGRRAQRPPCKLREAHTPLGGARGGRARLACNHPPLALAKQAPRILPKAKYAAEMGRSKPLPLWRFSFPHFFVRTKKWGRRRQRSLRPPGGVQLPLRRGAFQEKGRCQVGSALWIRWGVFTLPRSRSSA